MILVILVFCYLISASEAKTIDRVLTACQASGCFLKDHTKQTTPFVKCNTVVNFAPSRTNCRHGYSPLLNTSKFDFIYDFNSLYSYDDSIYESLAWAAPERTQFVAHALLHKPAWVAINFPISQKKWSYGVIWALKQLGIKVTEMPYDDNKLVNVQMLQSRRRNSSKWIGLTQSCQSVCRPCLRAMTLASYLGPNSSHLMYNGPILTCNKPYPHAHDMKGIIIKNEMNFNFNNGVMRLLRPGYYNHQKKSQLTGGLECRHIVLIMRLGKRAFIYPPPAALRNNKNPTSFKIDYRIIDVFQGIFGVDKVVPYFGNISTQETLRIFNRACAVVGPHGAATANTVFTSPYTYILEVTTHDIDMHRIPDLHPNITIDYISNVEGGLGTGVTWDVYTVGWDKVYPPVNPKLLKPYQHPGSKRAIHTHIQFQSCFILERTDYEAMAELTCSNVKLLSKKMRLCNHLSLSGSNTSSVA